MDSPVLSVYFDGLCRLCSAEIAHYQKRDIRKVIRWVDIANPQFSAEAEGLDPQRVHQIMHARDSSGTLYTEVDAFIAIWKVLPGFSFAARIAQWSAVRPFLNLGYRGFARVRPYLPRKKADACESGRCAVRSS